MLGARFDDRVDRPPRRFRARQQEGPCRHRPRSINKVVAVDVPVVADVGRRDRGDHRRAEGARLQKPDLSDWWRRIEGVARTRSLDYAETGPEIMPQRAIANCSTRRRKDRHSIITTEVGQHQMWAAQHFHFDEPNKWLTWGGLGTMGYGLPAAIGAQLGNPDALVIDVAGDAWIQMNIQEMGYGHAVSCLPVKIFILNNEYMGMVRQWQELTYESRYSHSYSDSLPDFVKLAEAYGWKGIRIEGAAGARSRHRRDDRPSRPGAGRLPRRQALQLLPDDPVGRRAHRHAARPQPGLRHDGRRGKGTGLMSEPLRLRIHVSEPFDFERRT